MKKLTTIFCIGLLLILSACSSPNARAENKKIQLTISAAASMTDSLMELKQEFENTNPSVEIIYNFGGSGALRNQIEQGATIDLFFSASEKDYLLLQEKGKVRNGQAIMQNQLAVISPFHKNFNSLNDLLASSGKIAIGTPNAVPAGTYAQQALEDLKLWEKFKDRFVFTKDVRQVLTLVKEGTVDAGLVYVSDIQDEEKITLIERIDSIHHDPINYYIAKISSKTSDDTKEKIIDQFYQYACSDDGLRIFKKYGFKIMKD